MLPYLFERALRLESLRGHVETAGGAGVAIWIPPRAPRATIAQILRSGLAFAPLRLRPGERLRLRRYLAACAELHRRDLADSWYLSGLAVDPERQGEGIGSSLLEEGLRKGTCRALDEQSRERAVLRALRTASRRGVVGP